MNVENSTSPIRAQIICRGFSDLLNNKTPRAKFYIVAILEKIMADGNEEILRELKEIRIEIQAIKENMPDKDMFLTAEEERLLEESYENEKRGDLVSSVGLRITP